MSFILHPRFCLLCVLAILAAVCTLGLQPLAAADPPPELQPAIGLNKFDLFMQYLGTSMGGDGTPDFQALSQRMARKAIADAAGIGVTYLRVSATGYAPSSYGEPGDLDLWRDDPEAYWALFDQMMDDLHAHNVRIAPVFVWNALQFPAMSKGETLADLIRDPESTSYRTLARYVDEFVTRYRDHPALYFYELTNELNDHADIDLIQVWCKNQPPCGPVANFTTDDLLAFTARLAQRIRSLDDQHLISSGFNLPRPAAVHLRRTPMWSPGGGDWTEDSEAEFRAHLAELHQDVDIISIHFYNGKDASGRRDNERWDLRGRDNVAVLDVVKEVADGAGKPLFVGEFGDADPTVAQDPAAPFTHRVLERVATLNIPLSAPWVWEFYQFTPYTPTPFHWEPGYTDELIQALQAANQALGNSIPEPPWPDQTPPRLVLSWPLNHATLEAPGPVFATASDDHGVASVVFLVDGTVVYTDQQAPFQFDLDPGTLTVGVHQVAAVAQDAAGNVARDAVTVHVPQGVGLHRTYLPLLVKTSIRLGERRYP